MTRHIGKSTSNLAQIKKNKQDNNLVSADNSIGFIVREYKNMEMDVITIPEPKLFNILKDWEEKREKQFKIQKNKIEKISILLSILSIGITLWSTYCTATFSSEFVRALFFLFSVLSIFALIVFAILTYRAFQVEEDNLCLDDLIRSIEKRTD